jgi:DNA helicase-2/ATP-dependent DNA helicase PcrA
MPSPTNRVVIAAAGARKTEEIIELALAQPDRRVLITTYTNENQAQIARRIYEKAGAIPTNVEIAGWFSFLLNQCARPYQSAVTGTTGRIRGLDFHGERNRYVRASDIHRYYFDSRNDMYRDGIADFVCKANAASDGAVVRRLERVYDSILIDEMQDLVGYDLDVLDLLFGSGISITAVGDPRQHTLSTNMSMKNRKFRGAGITDWLDKRRKVCEVEERNDNHRCNQAICDFADALFPNMPASVSHRADATAHDGVFFVARSDVAEYVATHAPVVLRDSRRFNTLGLVAQNIGVAKGSTYERVLIFPTSPMLKFLEHRDPSKLKAPERLYVAITRAKHSVAFVIPDPKSTADRSK